MRRRDVETFVFGDDELASIVALMADLVPRAGWLVLQPGYDEDGMTRRDAARVLRSRPPVVPVCTWVPGERTRAGVDYIALGIEHAAGRDAAALVDVPEHWHLVQDNPRRGLIVAAPPADPHDEVLAWLLAAGRALTALPLTGEWRAMVHRR